MFAGFTATSMGKLHDFKQQKHHGSNVLLSDDNMSAQAICGLIC